MADIGKNLLRYQYTEELSGLPFIDVTQIYGVKGKRSLWLEVMMGPRKGQTFECGSTREADRWADKYMKSIEIMFDKPSVRGQHPADAHLH